MGSSPVAVTDLMVKLKEKLNSKKDEDKLYGDLLATKLTSLSKINKLKAKHKIDNIMFTFQLQQDEESNLPPNHQTQNQCASEFIRSPPPTPWTPSCLQFTASVSRIILPDISSFQKLQPKGNQQYSYQNPTYLTLSWRRPLSYRNHSIDL